MFRAWKVEKFEFKKAWFGGHSPLLNPYFLLGLVYFEHLPISKIRFIYL